MYYQLKNQKYKIEGYNTFYIYEPKERKVDALHYKDRIVQHCICDNYLTPLLEKRLIYDNAATRIGKGTDFARGRLKHFYYDYFNKNKKNDGYLLKCDIHHFFEYINHNKLKESVEFLGFHYKLLPNGKILTRIDSKRRIRFKKKINNKIKEYKKGYIPLNSLNQSINSYIGYFKKGQYSFLKEFINCANGFFKIKNAILIIGEGNTIKKEVKQCKMTLFEGHRFGHLHYTFNNNFKPFFIMIVPKICFSVPKLVPKSIK